MASDHETRRRIELVDTTMRDGNQSLWSATGLTTSDIASIAATVDRVGFHAVDFTASTHMGTAVRYQREDPWQRLRVAAQLMPATPLTFLTTGTRFISWKPAADDVLELAFRTVIRNGVRRVQIMHPSNDVGALTALSRMARKAGAAEVVPALTYSVSPVHDSAHFARIIRDLADCTTADRFYLKDPGGLLVPDRVEDLVREMVAASGGRPVEVHSHCTTSLAPLVYVHAVGAGAGTLHTAAGPLARGTSQPSAEMTVKNLRAMGYATAIDDEALSAMSAYFDELAAERDLPVGVMPEYDSGYYRHQLPGGMATTMRRQLQEMGRPELFDRALAEAAQVRAEFGYPIMVTPLSQFVATQAVMNLMSSERYANLPDEVIRFFLGQFGAPPAPPDPGVSDRVFSRPRTTKLRELPPVSLEGSREKFGTRMSDEELLLRLTMPAEQVDAMVNASRPDREVLAAAQGGRRDAR